MSDNLIDELIARVESQRKHYEDTGVCDAENIKEVRSNAAKLLRITNGMPGSEESAVDFSAVKATDVAKSSQRGNWSSPKILGSDANFLILEAIRYTKIRKIRLPRMAHLDVIEAYYPALNRASIPPKLGDWRAASLVMWESRNPESIQLGVGGLQKMRDWYPAALEKREEIVDAMKILDQNYDFPEIGELLG